MGRRGFGVGIALVVVASSLGREGSARPLDARFAPGEGVRIDETADRSRVTVWRSKRLRVPARPALLVECESTYRSLEDLPFRLACAAHVETSTQAAFSVAVAARRGERYTGWALTRTSTIVVEGGQSQGWRLTTSTTGAALSELQGEGHQRQRLARSDGSSVITEALLLVPDLQKISNLGQEVPGQIPTPTVAWSAGPAREAEADRYLRLGRSELAAALRGLGAPPPVEDEGRRQANLAAAYDRSDGGGLSFAIGPAFFVPLGGRGGRLPRQSSFHYQSTFGFDFGRRFEAYGLLSVGSGSLDGAALSRGLGPQGENRISQGQIPVVLAALGVRWAPFAWDWRPYVVLQAGYLNENFQSASPDLPVTCGDRTCPHLAGFLIDASASAWDLAPGLGMRHALVNTGSLGLELRFEVKSHFAFWTTPLAYKGEVTVTGLDVYQRLRAYETGGAQVSLSACILLEGRAAVF